MRESNMGGRPKNNPEDLETLTQRTIDFLIRWANAETPESGDYKRRPAVFPVPGTSNLAFLEIEHFSTAPAEERTLTIGVLRNGTDRLYSNYMYTGNKTQMLSYLSENDRKDESVFSIKDLSNSVDKYWKYEDDC